MVIVMNKCRVSPSRPLSINAGGVHDLDNYCGMTFIPATSRWNVIRFWNIAIATLSFSQDESLRIFWRKYAAAFRCILGRCWKIL